MPPNDSMPMTRQLVTIWMASFRIPSDGVCPSAETILPAALHEHAVFPESIAVLVKSIREDAALPEASHRTRRVQ